MACFVVPAVEAVVVTAVSKIAEKRVEKHSDGKLPSGGTRTNIFLKRRKWLTNLLWGGSALLAFEHVWHGEIVPWFPFLSAAYSRKDTMIMLQEMATVGVTMAVVVTMTWIGMVLVSSAIEKRNDQQQTENRL